MVCHDLAVIEIQAALVWFLVTVGLALIIVSFFLFPRFFTPRCIVCLEPLTDQDLGDTYLVFSEEPMLWHTRVCSRCVRRQRLASAGRKI